MPVKTYINTVGKMIVLDTTPPDAAEPNDLSTAVSPTIEVRKPDGTTGSWPAEIIETSKLKYVTVAGDLDQAGTYYLQAKPNIAGYDEPGETVTFKVSGYFK